MFAAATVAKTTRPGIDFFPLTVDFEERLYAAGKIPGSFPRREGRPSEEGILTARLTDRPIRPLFPKGFKNDVQIVASAWSADQENDYDVLVVNAASAALHISDAPFEGPIGCVRVGTVGGKLTLNPTIQQMDESDLDLVVAGTKDSIMMIEAGARQVTEDFLIEALTLAQEGIKELCDAQEDLRRAVGKPKLTVAPQPDHTEKLAPVVAYLKERIHAKLRNPDKAQRETGLDLLKAEAVAQFVSEGSLVLAEEVSSVVRSDPRRGVPPRGHRGEHAAGRPRHQDHPAAVDRGRRSPAHARLRGVHPRPDPGPVRHDARADRRRADHRHALARRHQALHASLQLPALFGG